MAVLNLLLAVHNLIFKILFELIDHFDIFEFFGGRECSHDVLDLMSVVVESEIHEMPVVHDELKMVLNPDLLSYSSSISESLTHNGDEHVQEVDKHYECANCENNI